MNSTNNVPMSAFRRLAREGMKGHFWRLWLISLITQLPGFAYSFLSSVSLALRSAIYAAYAVLVSVMMCGWTRACARRLRGEDYGVGTLFWWDRLPRALAVWLALNGVTILQGFLHDDYINLALSALTILLTLTWGMAPYLWIDSPELSAVEALRRSRETMKGHRLRLLCLALSFLGWGMLYALAILLLGFIVSLVPLYFEGIGDAAIDALRWTTSQVETRSWVVAAGRMVNYMLLSMLMVYTRMSLVAFYEVLSGRLVVEAQPADPGDLPDDALEPEDDDVGVLDALGEAAWQSNAGNFYHGAPTPDVAMTAGEVAAWDVLAQHGFSHAQMEKDGVIEDYRALGVKPETEVRWRRDYANSALAAFREEGNPAIANAVVRLAVECGDPYALNGALEAMDDAVSAEKIGGMPALEVCANMAAALGSGAFDADAAFLAEARGQVGELVNRLVVRLNVSDPDGAWQRNVADIRGMLEP